MLSPGKKHDKPAKARALDLLANQLKDDFFRTGFFLVSSHGCEELISSTLSAAKSFHSSLSLEDKDSLAFGPRGVGYIKVNQRLLPKREKGNMNEAFIVKRELGPRNITLDSNPFPPEHLLPGFRQQVFHDDIDSMTLGAAFNGNKVERGRASK